MTASVLDRAHRAVFGVFALAGLSFSAWASRIPDAKVALDLSAGRLGSILLFLSAGSLVALPSTGRIVDRIGVRRTITAGLLASLVGLTGVGAGVLVGNEWLVAPALMLIGLGVGTWDVSMNLQGATVERHLGRTVMPHYHAAFSGATVVGALFGAAMSWAHVPVIVHLGAVGLLCLGVGVVLLRDFLPDEEPEEGDAAAGPARSGWREGRTLAIGAVVFAAAFTEGVANDWLSVAFVEGHSLPNWAGVLGFAVFLGFMTIGRLLGTRVLDRYGRVPVLRVLFGAAAVGTLLVVFGPQWLAYLGAAVWGLGAALGFPVGLSASADDPRRASARMSVVATIGYSAFIAGPPLLGYLGDAFGVLHSLLVVGALAVVAVLAIPAVREQRPAGLPATLRS
jgi:MFS family permease